MTLQLSRTADRDARAPSTFLAHRARPLCACFADWRDRIDSLCSTIDMTKARTVARCQSRGQNGEMCGRFFLLVKGRELAEQFDLVDVPTLEPRYNIAPTQPVAIVRQTADGRRLA